MELAVEKFDDVIVDAFPLLVKHRAEINLFDRVLDIDFNYYSDCCANDTLKIFTARINGDLIGYAAFFLYPHIHHKEMMTANADVIFVDKEHRGKGLKLIRFCDIMLKEIGVDTVIHSVPVQNDWGKVLTKMGYSPLETNYSRRL